MNNIKDLIEKVRKHLASGRFGQDQVFVRHWYSRFYYVGKYKKGDKSVRAYMVSYPASSPAGFVREGQARVFDL